MIFSLLEIWNRMPTKTMFDANMSNTHMLSRALGALVPKCHHAAGLSHIPETPERNRVFLIGCCQSGSKCWYGSLKDTMKHQNLVDKFRGLFPSRQGISSSQLWFNWENSELPKRWRIPSNTSFLYPQPKLCSQKNAPFFVAENFCLDESCPLVKVSY